MDVEVRGVGRILTSLFRVGDVVAGGAITVFVGALLWLRGAPDQRTVRPDQAAPGLPGAERLMHH